MLFLAVFCGFLAENYRENLSQNEDELQGIKLLVTSLESDTAELKKIINFHSDRSIEIDSFIEIKDADFGLKENRRLFYKHAYLGVLNSQFFRPNQVGIDQLKSSGSYRRIENDSVISKIGLYYNFYQNGILGRENDYRHWYAKTIEYLMQAGDFSIFGGSGKPGFVTIFFQI